VSRRRPLPPYGKRLFGDRYLHLRVNVFVYAGDRAHDFARPKPHALAVPTGTDWRAFDWSLLFDLSVTLVARGWTDAQTGELARHLIQSGAALVVAITVTSDAPIPRVNVTHYRLKRQSVAA
jgi:hypothetical protein